MTRLQNSRCCRLVVGAVLCVGACGGDDGDTSSSSSSTSSGGSTVAIGAILHSSIAENIKLRQQGAQLAIETINDAGGIFGHPVALLNREPVENGTKVDSLAGPLCKELYDQDHIVGIMSTFSSLGKEILEGCTLEEGYTDLVQVNASASAIELTALDTNDTFYRTVPRDDVQGFELVTMALERDLDKIAIYYGEDAFGSGLHDIVKAEFESAGESARVVWEGSHALDAEDVLEASENGVDGPIDQLLASGAETVFFLGHSLQQSYLLRWLIEKDFVGTAVQCDGSKDAANLLSRAPNVVEWLDAGNVIVGVEPNLTWSKHYEAFVTRFQERWSADPNTYSTSAYDTVMLIALAALASGEKDTYTAADVKENIRSIQSAGGEDVGIAASDWTLAATTLAGGQTINYYGAAGDLDWDATGDLADTAYRYSRFEVVVASGAPVYQLQE